MYNIVLCDDNKGFLDVFRLIVKKEFNRIMPECVSYKIGASFGKATDVISYAKTNRINVLFLDIDMPEMSGFELAKIFSRDYKNTLIIFMSAYDNFVYESFDYLPFAYIRKNNITDNLPKVVLRVRDKFLETTRYIDLVTTDKEIRIDAKQILYFESNKNYYTAHLTNGEKHVCRGTILALEQIVGTLNFFRTHSAFLVNLEHIEKITIDNFVLIGNNEIPISQKRLKDFKKKYLEYTRRCMGI